jgi:hypothetical protein
MFGATMSIMLRLFWEASIVGKCFGSLLARTAGNGESVPQIRNFEKEYSRSITVIGLVEHIV